MEGIWCLKLVYEILIMVVLLLLHINPSLSIGFNSGVVGHRVHANMTMMRCIERERQALLAIKQSLVDYHKGSVYSSWDGTETHNTDCCTWQGVYCSNQTGHVTELDLGGEYLKGTISPKLVELQHLKYLNLRHNFFNRTPIPEFIGSLTNLRYLDLSSSFFGGQIPYQLGNLIYLQFLDLSHNDFTHVDLNWLPHLSSLKYLNLGHNFFNWTQITEFIGSLTNLRYLDLSLNLYGGHQIPYQLGNLTHLQYLDLSYNHFTHVDNLNWLPHLPSLEYLDLSIVQLSNVSDWLKTVSQLPNLRNLTLKGCHLPPPILSSLSHINSSRSLASVDLSSNDITVTSSIFKWLGNYNTSIVHLDLSSTYLSGSIPDVKNLNWLPHLSSLEYLDLSGIQLSHVSDWLKTVSQLPNLRNLALEGCDLPPPILSSLSHINSSRSLASVVLSHNYNTVTSSIFKWLCNYNTSIVHLDLSSTKLSCSIPDVLANMSSLVHLDLSSANLSGAIPDVFANMTSLARLDLSNNNLEGGIPPTFAKLCSLQRLRFSNNNLSGKIPESIGRLSELEVISLGMNSLEGVISKTHFLELSKLQVLDLSFNSLGFQIPSDWVPPFQLNDIILQSCKLGPYFPKWLQTQKIYSYLDLSNTGISDILPSWFWGLCTQLIILNLSRNQIRGTLANTTLEFHDLAEVNLSSNQFEGPIPSFLSKRHYLDLSDNKISGSISFLCASTTGNLTFLNLSSNHLSGELPDCWTPLENLVMLDLSYNVFSGKIPTTMASLIKLETLKLRTNRFVGEFPSSLKNCTSLQVIDLGDNEFSGSIPEWLGVSLPNLVILMLQSNHFNGSLPSQLCNLTHIQNLDLSVNNISGSIPKCLNNLTTLSQRGNSTPTIKHTYYPSFFYISDVITRNSDHYEDDETFMWKGRMSTYKNTLGLVKRIDLSNNRLIGEIPSEISHLVELVSLNLSRNHLTGQIPPEIGKLQSLDSLDLSRNHIDGRIPTSLSRIDRLGFLDLSYNSLSGEIPKGTQLQGYDTSVYAGNPQLCGLPLQKMCTDPEQTGPDQSTFFGKQEDKDELISRGTYICMGVGFAVGFWGACGSLIFNRSWRYTYFNFFNVLNDWLYVRVALISRKLRDAINR